MEHIPTTDKRHHMTQVPPGSKKKTTNKKVIGIAEPFLLFCRTAH
jgi:hypothetical protein